MKRLAQIIAATFLGLMILTACTAKPATPTQSPTSSPVPKTSIPPTVASPETPLPHTTVDASTMETKLLMGYQGWFSCPGDGSRVDHFVHWFKNNTPSAASFRVDMWPDASELTPEERCQTNMKYPNGQPAYLYSAYNPKTVLRHFQWMSEYGVDGVFLQRFGTELANTIGSSETFLSYLATWRPESKPRSLGHPVPGWKARVIDEAGQDCQSGTIGRLAIQGPGGIMYWRNPEKQKEAVVDGWSLTGDLAYRDEDGCFWHISRSDDIIKSRGYRVSPGEVEDALLEHPAVFDPAVVGAPDPIQGHRVKAFVVLKEGYEGSPELAEELRQFVKARVAAYAAPSEIEFVTSLPKTETGKVRRIELKQLEEKRYAEQQQV